MSESTEKAVENVKKPLYATVGAGDAAVQAVADVVAKVRERTGTDVSDRVEDARERFAALPADVQEQIETLRDRLSGLPSELPEELAELREKFTVDELRKVAEEYLKVATDLYADLAERGEGTVERLRSKPGVEERIGRAEGFYNGVTSRTEGVLGKVSDRTRAVGEQAAKLTGRAQVKAEEAADVVADKAEDVKSTVTEKTAAAKSAAPAKKAPAKKAPAKKSAPAKKA